MSAVASSRACSRALDRAAIASADIVVLDTAQHAELLPRSAVAQPVVVPVGAAEEWFDSGQTASTNSHHCEGLSAKARRVPSAETTLRVVFFGLFTPLQGAVVIGRALALLAEDPRIRVTMIGSGQDLEETRAVAAVNPNITWIDWVTPGDLPSIVARHHVALGVFGTGPKTARVVPTKVFQSAAAGCAVVTGDTPPARTAFGGAEADRMAVLVPVGDEHALAAALTNLADDPAGLTNLRAAARLWAAEHFTPAAVTAPLADAMEQRSRRSASIVPAGRPRVGEMPAIPHDLNSPALPPLAPRAWLRYDVVDRLVRRIRPESVLEIGCGQGGFGARLASRVPEGGFFGIDPDAAAAQVAARRILPLGGTVVVGDHSSVPPGSTYDLVCAFEVLEHLEHDEEMLSTWTSWVRPGGHLLLSVPAWQERFGPMDERAGHYRRYEPEQLRDLLKQVGLEAVDVTVYGWPLGYVLEAVRNPLDARAIDRAGRDLTMAERTAPSGRTRQPGRRITGEMIRFSTMPFRRIQRLAPHRGTGLVAMARRPALVTDVSDGARVTLPADRERSISG